MKQKSPEPRSPKLLWDPDFFIGIHMRGAKKRCKMGLLVKIDTYSNLKSIDDGKGVLKHDGGFVYGKKAKNPANAQNWHQHKQTFDSSSGKNCELKISFDLLL